MAGLLHSPKAQTLFWYSSWMTLCMGVFMVFMVTPWFGVVKSFQGGEIVLRFSGAVLGVLGAPAALIIWVGMIICCLVDDSSTKFNKAAWCVLFFFAACFASAIYFFIVYRKQVQRTLAITQA